MNGDSLKNDSSEPNETVSQYFITEFQVLHQRASQQEQASANKINVYIASVSVVTGGIFIVFDKQTTINLPLLPIIITTLLFFLLVGVATLLQILDLIASTIFFYRRAGRIRKYFLDLNPNIQNYLPFEVADNRPRFYTSQASLRSVEAILLLVNAGIVSVLVGAIIWSGINYISPTFAYTLWISIASGLVGFVSSWMIQQWYVQTFLLHKERQEENSGSVYFPSVKRAKVSVKDRQQLQESEPASSNQPQLSANATGKQSVIRKRRK